MAVEDVWRCYRQWSAVARTRSAQLSRVRSVNLGLLLVGAVAGALAAQGQWLGRPATLTLGALGAAALALAAVLQGHVLTKAKVDQRLKTRSAAESFKALAYLYLAQAPPFAGTERDKVLDAKHAELDERAADVRPLVAGIEPDDMPLPNTRTAEEYLSGRAKDQLAWHDRSAARARARADAWRNASIAATGAAAVVGAVGGALHGPDLSAWVAVFATAATAFSAHLASEQYDRIASSYARTAASLEGLIRRFEASERTPEQARTLVSRVEKILAQQNDAWVELFEG